MRHQLCLPGIKVSFPAHEMQDLALLAFDKLLESAQDQLKLKPWSEDLKIPRVLYSDVADCFETPLRYSLYGLNMPVPAECLFWSTDNLLSFSCVQQYGREMEHRVSLRVAGQHPYSLGPVHDLYGVLKGILKGALEHPDYVEESRPVRLYLDTEKAAKFIPDLLKLNEMDKQRKLGVVSIWLRQYGARKVELKGSWVEVSKTVQKRLRSQCIWDLKLDKLYELAMQA